MRFSRAFIPTTKDKPADATLPSHQYLIRGGFISSNGAGLYNYLPLGKRVLEKIKRVIEQELHNAGCLQTELSFVTPMEYWEQSGRANKMGLEMLRVKDRKHNDFVLSPTNEEAMVNVVKNRVTSYKDLPLHLYQINTKFRDEARPRFGLLRGREFLMKDGYSFHADYDDLVREFEQMEQTYSKIFTRLGLEFRVVDADSGAIGGSGSKEFHILAQSGEDTIVVCDSCEYGANIEAAIKKQSDLPTVPMKYEKVHTPNTKTIEQLSHFLEIEPSQTIKAVIQNAVFEQTHKIVVFFVRGSAVLEPTKACNAIGALELEDATDEQIEQARLVAGYVGIENLHDDILYCVDSELKEAKNMVCGANEFEYHTKGIDVASLNLDSSLFADLSAVLQGDTCAQCGGTLGYTKGIESGHIFQLGTTYSEPLGANFLDENGKSKPFEMGTYGIGVSRLIAAVIEQSHDEKGCIWTESTAPYLVDVIVSNAKKEHELQAGEEIYEKLQSAGIEAILDDRKKERFGFKMGDFELIGFPYAIVVGKKLDDNIVEIVERKTLQKQECSIDEVVQLLQSRIDTL